MNVVHTRQLQVALGDTDAARVIYYPVVFRWHEYSFSEWLASQFRPLSEVFATGFGLPVVNCSATYSGSIRQDDRVTVESWITDVGASSFTFGSTVSNKGTVVGKVETRHVWVQIASDGKFSSAGIPAELRNVLRRAISPRG